jgi:Caudovirus prohead serine protease
VSRSPGDTAKEIGMAATTQEVAATLGVTRMAVSLTEQRAIRKLWQDKKLRRRYLEVDHVIEHGTFESAIELRSAAGPSMMPRITGLAARYDTLSATLPPGFREKIARGAFDASLAAGDDVKFLVNHEPSTILGRSGSGTLRLYSEWFTYSGSEQ